MGIPFTQGAHTAGLAGSTACTRTSGCAEGQPGHCPVPPPIPTQTQGQVPAQGDRPGLEVTHSLPLATEMLGVW